ncbi:hypothetical protein OIDMADRAFT_169109 [Oidiodendron maius Zn]|uniref:NDT80 domain-containing protein n=1 Tax=Oidiodendron maius (strain Zn) TaxID=913774 RepID=A0A0C3CEJ2_OIDMZ|nr:hypothetical protein OIDMADRAFT_169109 [Oidiodendron maius Zn]
MELHPLSFLDPSLVEQSIPEFSSAENLLPKTPNSKGQDNLFSFRACPSSKYRILNSTDVPRAIGISAQLSGMFFVAESPFDNQLLSASEVLPLTCYRRNLFKVTGTIYVPQDICSILGPDGDRETVHNLSVSISAFESFGGKSIKIISVPLKHGTKFPSAHETSPTSIKLDMEGNTNQHADPFPFPVRWERLQFRTATAKNNRRSMLQQHYSIAIKVMGTFRNGSKALLCEANSPPVVVRGRSPKSYENTRSAISASASVATKKLKMQEPKRTTDELPGSVNIPTAPTLGPITLFIDESDFDTNPVETQLPVSLGIEKLSSNMAIGSMPHAPDSFLAQKSNILKPGTKFADSSRYVQPKDQPRHVTSELNASPIDGPTWSYEYFPLAIGDWTPPVEGVYRPHGFHHHTVEQSQKRNRKKRYYVE